MRDGSQYLDFQAKRDVWPFSPAICGWYEGAIIIPWMVERLMKCWICGADGTTGEHKIKRSDLRSLFGERTQAKPLHLHDRKIKNRPIGSLDAKALKFPSLICAHCNNALTQPHDRAWERMSGWLRIRNPSITAGTIVRADRIFPYDTAREMRNIHLYFVKLFGCIAVESTIRIDVTSLAHAILNDKAHPIIYLKFGQAMSIDGKIIAGSSDIETESRTIDGPCAFATWFYYVGDLAVNVMFAAPGEKRQGLVGAWHPRFGTNRLMFSDFL